MKRYVFALASAGLVLICPQLAQAIQQDQPFQARQNILDLLPEENEAPEEDGSAAVLKNLGAFAYQAQNPRHRACIEDITIDAQAARDKAQQWVRDSGGPMAAHCLAVADMAAGYPRIAAVRLQKLGEQESAGDGLTRARLFAQAAEIWLSINEADTAADAVGAAFALSPNAGELFLLAGRVQQASQRWPTVIDSITTAEELGFYSVNGYAARARAYKELTQLDLAAEDVARALRLDPFHLDSLVIRGELVQAGIDINLNFRKRGDVESDASKQ